MLKLAPRRLRCACRPAPPHVRPRPSPWVPPAALAQKVDAELARALASLESEKASAMKSLDAQVEKLSADILGRVLPEGVRV